ncbi:MAG: hypothetical protein OHK0046_46480 [Anaerolineae bacterium]
MLDQIIVRHIYTYHAPSGTISERGITAINDYIFEQNLLAHPMWAGLNETIPPYGRLPQLPLDWDWVWLVERGEYRGTFPKRVRKFYHTRGIKTPDQFIAILGNLAREHAESGTSYRFDFTDTMDWNAGDFGDKGSCYWGGRRSALRMLENNDALAIRFYNEEGKGFGRAWVARHEPDTDLAIVFNGYGLAGNATLRISRILADWLGVSYKKITLANRHTNGGTLYINASGTAYLIGESTRIETLNHHDLDWETYAENACSNCGTELQDEEVYMAHDEVYCMDCFYDRYDHCAVCGTVQSLDDMSYSDDYGHICDVCTDRYFTWCEHCREYVHNRHILTRNEKTLCRQCGNVIE